MRYCNVIPGLFEELGLNLDPREWRLFIEALVYSTKVVPVHIGSKHSSCPAAHCIVLQETYGNLSFISSYIDKWLICEDLKNVAIVSDLRAGCTKYIYFLRQWNSRDREEQ